MVALDGELDLLAADCVLRSWWGLVAPRTMVYAVAGRGEARQARRRRRGWAPGVEGRGQGRGWSLTMAGGA